MSNLISLAMANAAFYYPSKDGQSLYATPSEFLARKQFKRRRQSPIILATLPQHVVAKFKPKFLAQPTAPSRSKRR